MVARDAGHREHVVERHRHVRNDDLDDRVAHALGRRRAAFALSGGPGFRRKRIAGGTRLPLRPDLAPQLPRHPQQHQAAGEQQSHDLEELHRHRREPDAHQGRGCDADGDDAGPILRRQPRGGHADHDRVVPREHEVDDDDLKQGAQLCG